MPRVICASNEPQSRIISNHCARTPVCREAELSHLTGWRRDRARNRVNRPEPLSRGLPFDGPDPQGPPGRHGPVSIAPLSARDSDATLKRQRGRFAFSMGTDISSVGGVGPGDELAGSVLAGGNLWGRVLDPSGAAWKVESSKGRRDAAGGELRCERPIGDGWAFRRRCPLGRSYLLDTKYILQQ